LLEPGAVKRIQERLHEQGFLPEHVRSGKLDGRTRQALRELQEKYGLPATGAPDDLTLQKLGLDAKELARSARPDN
jgi:peptidoglycan hydrolase-like protein with peptidoglycan-binding domain